MGIFSPSHWLVLGIIAFLVFVLFGHRLPSVMRSLGQGIVEFKKGLSEIKDESEKNSSESSKSEKSDKV
ncbi:MAG: twin-arginine translocase TatA/TatE family subunit [Thermoguttaceae bacterium]